MDLDGNWLLECTVLDNAVPMNIPGNFEDALLTAGVIADPYVSNNSLELRKFEFTGFTLSRKFKIDSFAGDQYRLTFDGIDGIADVFVNGIMVGSCRNSFIPHSFILQEELAAENELKIVFKSCIGELKKYPLRNDMYSSYSFNAEAARFRRPAHIWGWDILPRMPLGGIFYGVTLEKVKESSIEEFDLVTLAINDNTATMRLTYKVDLPSLASGEQTISISGVCENSRFEASSKLRSYCGFIYFSLPDAKLWWPRRYGASPLYNVKITLKDGDAVVDEKSFDFGIRTCSLIAEPLVQERAEPDFQFIVNNKKIRVFGTNHVPLDCLHSHSKERREEFFKLACECQVDMLRIWGGGVYEPDEFYDLCDRHGILVWQDFMMGCAVYPQDKEFLEAIENEASTVIRRLRRHCSIVLWAGDNECDVAPTWGRLNIAPESNKLTREVLADVCRKYDLSRPYLPSSPWCSPEALAAAPAGSDPTLLAPEQHLWGPRDYFKSDFYRNSQASFLSEFGYLGAPNIESIEKFIPPEFRRNWQNDICRHHASNPFLPDDTALNYRIDLMYDQVKEFFGTSVPDKLEDLVKASQIVQAEALKFIIELFRMKKKCSGLLWWNLQDGWPQFSDAVVDYYGGKKLAFHILKRLQKKLLCTLSESSAWHRRVMAANDSSERIAGYYTVKEFSSGRTISEGRFDLEPDTISVLDTFKVCTTQKELYLIECITDAGERIFNHYLAGYPQFDYHVITGTYFAAMYEEAVRDA